MKRSFPIAVVLAAAFAAIAGCTTASPTVYEGLASAGQLRPNPEDDGGRIPYAYRSNVDWRQYDKMIIDPVTLYRGPDSQFVKMEEKDKLALAAYMQSQFTETLRPRFAIVGAPGPGTLRLRLTLTGAKTTTPVLGPFSHFDVAGGVYNGVQAVRGREGSMTGSVNYAVEIYDAATSRLLNAFVAKQYPNAMNVGATFSALDASKVGIRKGADALLEALR
ncbi:DUF3313 domain-containing protein [Rhizobium pisi]|uniref:DUF3313 domain-containing protein n=1 Tax=Rhizobium pisi TaxID=574561 RepID=UPI0039B115A0